jgi:hypothetical protein
MLSLDVADGGHSHLARAQSGRRGKVDLVHDRHGLHDHLYGHHSHPDPHDHHDDPLRNRLDLGDYLRLRDLHALNVRCDGTSRSYPILRAPGDGDSRLRLYLPVDVLAMSRAERGTCCRTCSACSSSFLASSISFGTPRGLSCALSIRVHSSLQKAGHSLFKKPVSWIWISLMFGCRITLARSVQEVRQHILRIEIVPACCNKYRSPRRLRPREWL